MAVISGSGTNTTADVTTETTARIAADTNLQTNIDTNNTKFGGTRRVVVFDGDDWVPDDGFTLGDRTGDAGRPYEWVGPDDDLDTQVALLGEDYDTTISTDGDPLVFPTGIEITESSGDAELIDDHTFTLKPRASAVLGYPVPTLKPVGADTTYNCAFDIMPKGAPGDNGTNGICWIDVCDTDVLDSGTNVAALRLGMLADHVEIGSRGFGSSSAKPIYMGVAMAGTIATAQLRMANDGSTPAVVIGAETTGTPSAVVLGNGVALATNATKGFTYLPSVAGTPTGAAQAYGAQVPIVIDTTGSKIWVRIGGTWKSVAVA